MSGPPRHPRLRSCLLALLLLVLAPAALDSGRPQQELTPGEQAETAAANALGPSHESALVVKGAGSAVALRDAGRTRIPAGSLPLLAGALVLLLGYRALAGPVLHPLFRALRPLPPPAPIGPRAPPVPRLT